MPFYDDKVEYEDVLDGHYDEDWFPNHGKVVCVKELNENCRCLRCKPHTKKFWRISKCKYGPNPWMKMDEKPEGCQFLAQPNDFYCKNYCSAFDAKIKAQAFKEIFGFRGRLSEKHPEWTSLFEDTMKMADEILGDE